MSSSSSSSLCHAGDARRGDRDTRKGMRKLPAKKGKTPLRGKTERKETGEREMRDKERNRRITHLSLALCLNSGDGMWCSFVEPGA